jgi:hypothetical protein
MIETRVKKDPWGAWKAESYDTFDEGRRFKLHTSKLQSGAVVTTASVCRVEGMFESHTLYEDFHLRVEANTYPRATCAAISKQHDRAIARIAELKQKAVEFYANKGK